MVDAIKNWLGIVREAMIIVAVGMVLLFPTEVGSWLFARGVQKIEIGGATVSLAQFNQTRAALNAVQAAQNAAPGAETELQNVATQLRTTLVDQVRTLSNSDTSGLPSAGWIYLGTLNEAKTDWKPKLARDVTDKWPIHPNDVVRISTDTNLRAETTTENRPIARILSVLPEGTRVRIIELDTDRKVAEDSADRPGYRAWASVEVVH
jgi:hypothetical protein